MELAEYQGKVYLRIGGEWLTADYQKPPLVVVQALERLYGSDKDRGFEKKVGWKDGRKRSLSIQSQVAPEIVDVIQNRFEETGAFVTLGEIVSGLMEWQHIRDLLREAYEGQTGFDSFEEYVGNQIDFFSKGITEETSEFMGIFERAKINGKWAYRQI